MRHVHLFGFPRVEREPEILDQAPSVFFKVHPLLRCLAVYRTMPVRFALTFTLLLIVNATLTWHQHLIGVAVHELELGKLVTRSGDATFDTGRAEYWVVVLIGIAVARMLLQYVAGVAALITGQELLFRIRDAILAQVQRLDMGYHLRHGIGEIVSRTTRDADKVRDALISFWRNVIETGLVVAACLFILAWYNPVLAVVPALLVAVGITMFSRQADTLVLLDRAAGDAYDSVSQELLEGVGGVRVIKSFSLEGARIARFNEVVTRFAEFALQAIRYSSVNIPIPQVVVAFGQVWVFAWGTVLVARGNLNIGELVASVLAMNTLIFRFEGIGRIVQTFADARSSAARIMDFLDAEPKIRSGSESLPEGPLGFRLRGVELRSESHAGGVQILKSLNLEVAPGEVVALVGATGSGKSTLTALLPRLLDASSGVVEIGSHELGFIPVGSLKLTDLRRRVHVSTQECFLFSDSVADNLRVVAPHASDAELKEALRLASAEDIVDELPEGLNTRIGDRGVTLSGGQRQRLALARALIARPSIIVLDDSTSALDALTEQRILNNIHQLNARKQKPTMLLIASKPSTVRFADRIVVLDKGEIVATGSHPELLEKSAVYKELMGLTDGD